MISAGAVPALCQILLKSAGSVAKLGPRPNIQCISIMRDGNETKYTIKRVLKII